MSYASFVAAVARLATLLERAGVEPGDRVGAMLPNTPTFAIVFYGIIYRGAVADPMNPLLKAREVAYYLNNSGAKALFATPAFADEATAGAAEARARCWLVDDAGLAELIEDLPGKDAPEPRDDDDVAVILHTSGTTGEPKGAMLTHRNLSRNAEVSVRTLIETGPGDVVMGCLPLFHVLAHLRADQFGARRYDADALAPVPPGQGSRGYRARRRHGFPGCADDVFGAARCGRPGHARIDAQSESLRLRWRGAARPGRPPASGRLRSGCRSSPPCAAGSDG